MNRKHKLIWAGIGLLTIGIRWMAGFYPELVERYYSRGVFLGVRWLIDNLLSWLPVPLIYLFLIFVLWLVFRIIRRLAASRTGWPEKLLESSLSLFAFLGGVIFFFLFLWGFNYIRLPLEQQLGLQMEPLSLSELKKELEWETDQIIELRSSFPGLRDSIALSGSDLPGQLERQLQLDMENWLRSYHFPTTGQVRGRLLYPKGVFLHFSSSGLYFPFTGEGHVDAGLHPLQLPYVMAHELGHGYGFGDEGTCNFLSYLACTASEDPFIAYSGHLNYWRTLAANYRQFAPDHYRELRRNLPPAIQADLDAINVTLLKYPDLLPDFRYYAYEQYLKAQGIKEGMANYNRVIMLVKAWRNMKES